MYHNHCHRYSQLTCQHEHVKYCSTCKVCYCEDCGKDFPEKEYIYQYYPWYTTTTPYIQPLSWPAWSSTTCTQQAQTSGNVSYTYKN